jgi:hypothetical protein
MKSLDKFHKIVDKIAIGCILIDPLIYMDAKKMRALIGREILPNSGWMWNNRLYAKIWERIKDGNLGIEDDLGVWTPSFCLGLKTGGKLRKHVFNAYYINIDKMNSLYMDFMEIKLPINIWKEHNRRGGRVSGVSKCPFFEYGCKEVNEKEYLAGLFSGAEIIIKGKEEWYFITSDKESLDRCKGILDKWKIVWEEHNEHRSSRVYLGIIVSPFYGALFFGNMPVHSASRALNFTNPGHCPSLPYIYWNMIRKNGERKVPSKKDILPFSHSYATYYNNGLKEKDWRKKGIDIGILGMSDELRNMLFEWMEYRKTN